MPYSRDLEGAIEAIIATWPDIEKKKMFGGVCYLLDGTICFGIWRDYLIVRAGAATAAAKLEEPWVKPFAITGKPMKGWLMVAKEGVVPPPRLAEWLSIGRDFALTLPPK